MKAFKFAVLASLALAFSIPAVAVDQRYPGANTPVPVANATTNGYTSDVVGNKTDTAVETVSATASIMADVKGIIQLLNGDVTAWPSGAAPANGKNILEGIRYIAESVTAVSLGAMDVTKYQGDATTDKTGMAILKGLLDAKMGTAGVTSWPVGLAPADGVNELEAIRYIAENMAATGAAMTLSAGAVTASVVATDAIGAAEIADNAIDVGAIAAGAIGADEIAADAITSAEVAADTIGASEIAASAIGADEIAADAIGASELATDAIGAAEIAADALTTAELATGCISNDEIAADAIGASEIAADAITNAEIANDAIGATEIANDAIDATAIATGAIDADAIAADAITIAELATGCISADEVADNSIDAGAIAADAITNAEIANDAIGATEIATGAVDADAIAADAITNAEIANDAIGATEIATGAIDADAIAADALTTAELATGCISADEVADDSIDAGAIATGAIGSDEIAANAITSSELATDAIGADEVSAAAVTKIQAGLATTTLVDQVVKKTGATTSGTTTNLFTVTGLVQLRVVGVVTTDITRAGGAVTLSVGTATTVAGILPQRTDARSVAGQIFSAADAISDIGAMSGTPILANACTVIQTTSIATDGGIIDWYCIWRPISAGATVVSATGP